MRHAINEEYSDLEVEEVAPEYGDVLTERLDQQSEIAERSMPVPPYSALMMPGSRAALMAVVDDNGYLIPICTAFDLLRGCKYFWRASLD
ncbi:MAG TPA: hypothetical protein VH985_04210 [Candidatus Binatia bacterium]|jgi:hypothetical protein